MTLSTITQPQPNKDRKLSTGNYDDEEKTSTDTS